MSTAASSGRRCPARPLLPLRRKLRGCSPCLLNDHATPELRLKTRTQSGASPGYAPQPRHQSHRARAHHDDADPGQGRASHRIAHYHPRQEGHAANAAAGGGLLDDSRRNPETLPRHRSALLGPLRRLYSHCGGGLARRRWGKGRHPRAHRLVAEEKGKEGKRQEGIAGRNAGSKSGKLEQRSRSSRAKSPPRPGRGGLFVSPCRRGWWLMVTTRISLAIPGRPLFLDFLISAGTTSTGRVVRLPRPAHPASSPATWPRGRARRLDALRPGRRKTPPPRWLPPSR